MNEGKTKRQIILENITALWPEDHWIKLKRKDLFDFILSVTQEPDSDIKEDTRLEEIKMPKAIVEAFERMRGKALDDLHGAYIFLLKAMKREYDSKVDKSPDYKEMNKLLKPSFQIDPLSEEEINFILTSRINNLNKRA